MQLPSAILTDVLENPDLHNVIDPAAAKVKLAIAFFFLASFLNHSGVTSNSSFDDGRCTVWNC